MMVESDTAEVRATPSLEGQLAAAEDMVKLGHAQSLQYLRLQARLQKGTFSALSNLLKARFDAMRKITQGWN